MPGMVSQRRLWVSLLFLAWGVVSWRNVDQLLLFVSAGSTRRKEEDFVLSSALANNGDRMRKRRLDLGLSPDIQVSNKFRLFNARLNISQLLLQD
jgi:hypothetical protein